MITFIDLFAGIGGFRLAFESVGAKCVFSAEIDKHACATYKANFGDDPYCDVSQLDPRDIPDFDILCAGFPCQPFSIAGERKGFSDTRGTLFFDIERIIKAKQPKAFILENVKGLTSHDKGNTLKVIIDTLTKKLNYNVFYKVLNSNDYGVPQNRERIYIIGFKDKSIEFEFPQKLDKKVDLNAILSDDLSGSEISETAKFNIINNLKNHKKFNEIKDNPLLLAYEIRKSRATFRYDSLAPTLTAKMGTGGNNVPVLVNQMRKLTTRECLRIQGFPDSFWIEPNKAQSYKQIGNSVSVPVVVGLAKAIKKNIINVEGRKMNQYEDKYQYNLNKINESNPKIKKIYQDILNWIILNEYRGGCHLISAVMYMIYNEINIKSELCIGEVLTENGEYFSHSWIEIDNKIYDISIVMPLLSGTAFPPIYNSKDLETNKPTLIQYGFNSKDNLDEISNLVLNISLGEYSELENGKLFKMTEEIANMVNVQLDIKTIEEKYSSVYRTLVG